jgi:hypothetical protein
MAPVIATCSPLLTGAPSLADSIYAISLHQPWASFIAIGVKPFETRHWSAPTWLIGKRIAIHAAKKSVDADNREWARRHSVSDLPLGAIVCTALLAGAYKCGGPFFIEGDRLTPGYVRGSAPLPTSEVPEDEFGDYVAGRWAWWLTDIQIMDPPVPARGFQGLWRPKELQA